MRGVSLLSVFAIGLLVGCSLVERRSDAFACDTIDDCSDGRVCTMGWCVVSDPTTPDAAEPTIDADPANVVDARPPNECLACSGGTCVEECTLADNCSFDCAIDGCDCDFTCETNTCNVECKANTTCSVDCGGSDQCRPTCKPGAVCDFDCTNSNNCRLAKCEGDAQCILNCFDTDPGNCKWDVCDGVEMSCPGNIKVCGRDCP